MDQGQTVNQPFPTTRWTLILKASGGFSEKRSEALEELCKAYWPPVYAFIRSRGKPSSEAEDLTQGFFAEFLSKDEFSRVDGEKGKLRTYLLKAVTNFMAKTHRDQNRQKRGGEWATIPLDWTGVPEENRILELEDHLTPEIIFERQWAMTVLERVLENLRKRYEEKGKGELFEALRFVISPGSEGPTYSEIASRLGLTETAVKVAAFRLRERYALQLRESIADTLLDDSDIESEIQRLMSAFR